MTDSSTILGRITRGLAAGADDVFARLCALSPRDLQSLLLALYDDRARRRTVAALREDFGRLPLFSPGPVDPRLSLRIAAALYEAAADFAAVELSPVVPFAATHVLGQVHQNNVLTATRAAELVADPTTALALIAAQRRAPAESRGTPLRLCALHRCTRMQPAPQGLLPHFRLFALVTADRDGDGLHDLRRHLAVYLGALAALSQAGFALAAVQVDLADTVCIEERLAQAGVDRERVRREIRTEVFADADAALGRLGLSPLRGSLDEILAGATQLAEHHRGRLAALEAQVRAPLAAQFPWATLRFDLSRTEGLGYYRGPCVRITAVDASGLRLPLVDGGYTNWTARLLSDRRERLLATGIGADLLALRFFAG
jgi:hypothetical protein